MKKIITPIVITLFLVVWTLSAQQIVEPKPQDIFEVLENKDSTTQATVKIHQDQRVEKLLVGKGGSNYSYNSQNQATVNGFRVQVFSSNMQRTAKTDAFKIEKLIREEFPNEGVYVNYTSPFWKVRVGDFKTMSEAQSFRAQLIETFPSMRSETYVVREQVFISGSK